MAEKSLRVRYTGDASQLQSTQKQIGAQTASLGSTFKNLAGAVGIGFGVAAVVSFGKEIIAAGNAAQESNKRLQAAAKGTSVDVQQLVDDFAEMGYAGAQDDEMLKDLASTLLRMGFKGSTAQLEAEVQAITDLGAATSKGSNIITRFFVALNSGNLGKAITSAKTLGLVTQQQAEHFIQMTKAGRGAEVQQKLLTIAQTRAHGAAAEQATDLDILINYWEEFKEDLGVELIKNLTDVYDNLKLIGQAFKPITDALNDFRGAADKAGEGGSFLTDMFHKLAEQANSTFPYVVKLYDAFKAYTEYYNVEAIPAAHTFSAAEKKILDQFSEAPAVIDPATAAIERNKEKTKEWLKSALGAFNVMDQGLTGVKRAWELTAAAAVKATGIIAEKQQTIARDLRKLGDLKIGDGLKNQLIALGPDMVHAFMQGTPKQRAAIKQNLQTINDAQRETNEKLKEQSRQAGYDTAAGVGKGLDEGTGLATAAAQRLGARTLAALRNSLEVHSASKATIRMGKDIIQGLIDGLSSRSSELTKAFDKVAAQLDRIEDRAKSFKDSIRSGFSGIADLASGIGGLFDRTDANGDAVLTTAEDIANQIVAQAQAARDLATALKAAARAGLNQDLVAQFAGQGAAAMPALNALLANPELIEQLNTASEQIAAAARGTAEKLGDRFFGAALDRTRERLQDLAEGIRAFIEKLRGRLDNAGDELASAIRDIARDLRQAVQAQQQNLGGGGGGNNNYAPTVNVRVNGTVVAQDDLMKAVRRAAQVGSGRNAFTTGFA